MDARIKEELKILTELGGSLASVAKIDKEKMMQAIQIDLLNYTLYLSSSDGNISSEEANNLNYYFGHDLPPAAWRKYIVDNQIYSTKFENTVPSTLKIFVDADNKAHAFGLTDTSGSLMYLDLFEKLGQDIITCDSDVDNQELADFKTYLGTLLSYVKENLGALQDSNDTGISKVNNSSSAPLRKQEIVEEEYLYEDSRLRIKFKGLEDVTNLFYFIGKFAFGVLLN